MSRLAIVVPCYNEEDVLPSTIQTLSDLLDEMTGQELISVDSYILFIDDGSTDSTWEIISNHNRTNRYVRGLKLAGNVGHQNALVAGLEKSKDMCDMAISIDADLQDDEQAMKAMVELFHKGYDIVYGVRSVRRSDTFFKRFTAQTFYKIQRLFGIKSIYNHADYRLMSKRALAALSGYKERNLFLRGLIPSMGFKSECVYYERKKRMAGVSKYPLSRMISLAFDGITSFSVKPMGAIISLGILMIVISIIALGYSIFRKVRGEVVPGWTSLMLSVWIIGGILTVSIGVVGQYVAKTYIESKERPRYIVDEELFEANGKNDN